MHRWGFLTFGWWSEAPGSKVRSPRELMVDTLRLAGAAEDAGLDGAWLRVHHWEHNISSPFPLLAAMGALTERIELGTAVVPMRYENPLTMAEAAATADLVSGGRLQVGVSRGGPEHALDGPAEFGHLLHDGVTAAADAARRIALFRRAIGGAGIAEPGPQAHVHEGERLPLTPFAPGLTERIWYGAGSTDSARHAGELGMHLLSSTLVLEATGEPLHVVQARQIEEFRSAWHKAGHMGEPRVAVSRSILPIVDDETLTMFAPHLERDRMGANQDQIGEIDNAVSTFGKTYVGTLDKLEAELREDDAVTSADTLLATLPNQLGADFNAKVLAALADLKGALAG
ncbi:LLM class flavin-dependent oxidoreductase [Demequina pelophila]|uniref:LLM class flavin-dependent oxidoreductase n=1 Tax=Demequina pelophila TaxID=1638984 RepID=UPI0007832611|nr:LLM class flavin-dependent oxidoreductase [Demequina pelophila]